MPRSRMIFFVIIGLAIVVVVVVTLIQQAATNQQNAQATAQSLAIAQATTTAIALPSTSGATVLPIFAGGKPPTDNLPTYTCAADAFGSYYALEQMQIAGYDVKYGFHLGLIPFYLPGGEYDFSEDVRTNLLENGNIDCLFTTLDSVALK